MANDLTLLQTEALECIKKHPKSNPITGAKLAAEINLEPRDTGKDGADMRSVINALRTKGKPICAGARGYFWPKDYAELNQYIDEFQRRIDDQQKAINGLRRIAGGCIERVEDIKDQDLDEKLRMLLRSGQLSFGEAGSQKLKEISDAIAGKDIYRKRQTIRKYLAG